MNKNDFHTDYADELTSAGRTVQKQKRDTDKKFDKDNPETWSICSKHQEYDSFCRLCNPDYEKSLLTIEKVLNIDNLKDNDTVFFKITEITPGLAYGLKEIGARYGKKLKERGVSIMVIAEDVKIEVLDEKSMNDAGWYKKGKIITL